MKEYSAENMRHFNLGENVLMCDGTESDNHQDICIISRGTASYSNGLVTIEKNTINGIRTSYLTFDEIKAICKKFNI